MKNDCAISYHNENSVRNWTIETKFNRSVTLNGNDNSLGHCTDYFIV